MKEQLLSADIHANGLVEDVYLITPNNSGDGTVQLAVTHLSRQNRKAGTPIVLIHGQFTNRSVWFDHSGSGFAEFLTELGYDVWIPEMRGHGLSPENRRFQYNNLTDYIDYDLPAIQKYIIRRVGHAAIWFGYGLSGIALSSALAKKTLDGSELDGLVLLGLDDPRGAWRSHSFSRILNWRERRRGFIEADLPSGSLEPEAYGVIHSAANLFRPASGSFEMAQQSFKDQLRELTVPLLMLAGPKPETNQLFDAQRTYEYWGGSNKAFNRYEHADSEYSMIHGTFAQSHIWKHIEQWLADRLEAAFPCVRSA